MITPEQKQLRRSFLGSSDTAAIMGLDPYRSAADVFLEKTGQLDEWDGNDATRRGDYQEPGLLMFAEDALGVPVDCDFGTRRHTNGIMVAHLDGICLIDGKSCLVECKSTVRTKAEEWGEPWTDEVPQKVVIQIHHQMACAPEIKIGYAPVVTPGFTGFDYRMYRLDRDEELVAIVEKQCVEFWNTYVKPNRKPDDFVPSPETLKRIRRIPKKQVEIDSELVINWRRLKEQEKAVKEATDAAYAAILAQMDDADGAKCNIGELTYFETNRKGYTVKPSTFRTLRFKESK